MILNITKKEALEIGAYQIKIKDLLNEHIIFFSLTGNNRKLRHDKKIWVIPCFNRTSGGINKKMGVHYCVYINKEFIELVY